MLVFSKSRVKKCRNIRRHWRWDMTAMIWDMVYKLLILQWSHYVSRVKVKSLCHNRGLRPQSADHDAISLPMNQINLTRSWCAPHTHTNTLFGLTFHAHHPRRAMCQSGWNRKQRVQYDSLLMWLKSSCVPWPERRCGCWRARPAPAEGPGCRPRPSWAEAEARSRPPTDDTSSGPSACSPRTSDPQPSPASKRSRQGRVTRSNRREIEVCRIQLKYFLLGYLSNTLHGAAYFMGHALKAVQVPTGDFGDNVVQAGLETGCCFLWHSVLDLGQGDSQSQFGGNKCQRIPGKCNGIRTWQKKWKHTSQVSWQEGSNSSTLPSLI